MLELGFGFRGILQFLRRFGCHVKINERVYIVLNSFTWKKRSLQKKLVRQTLANRMFMFSGTFCPTLFSDIGLLITRESLHI